MSQSTFTTEAQCDVAIIGAGPAGLSAATTLSGYDVSVVLLDQQNMPGGQIYRNIENQCDTHATLLGPDYQSGAKLIHNFRTALANSEKQPLSYLPNAKVWSINAKQEIAYSKDGLSSVLKAKRIIIASGAMERPVPFPGWTLPGVMNAGAAQILFKAQQLLPENDVVLAGCGPLLYLLAWQYLQAGLKIQALLDLSTSENHLRALKHFPFSLTAWGYLKKGMRCQRALKAVGIPVLKRVSHLSAEGEGHLTSVNYQIKGRKHKLTSNRLLIHFGVIPQTNLSQLADCHHHWHDSQQCWIVTIDQWGTTNIPNIYSAGDAAMILGAKSAQYQGRITAHQCLHSLDKISATKRDAMSSKLITLQAKDSTVRPFLEAWFRIPETLFQHVDSETLICRCEEVSAATIRNAVHNGHRDINQVKFFTRCGMGPCQGRQCSQAVSQIVAAETAKSMEEVGQYRARPPLSQLTLGELAALYPEEQE